MFITDFGVGELIIINKLSLLNNNVNIICCLQRGSRLSQKGVQQLNLVLEVDLY